MGNTVVKPRHLLTIIGNVFENSKGMMGLYLEVSLPIDNKKEKLYNGKVCFVDIHASDFYQYMDRAIDELSGEMKKKAKKLKITYGGEK